MRDILKNTILITTKSIKDNFSSKTMVIVFLVVTVMVSALLSIFFCILLISPEIRKASPDTKYLKILLSLIMYTTSLLCHGINMNVFATQSIIKEKAKGNIESLLATPLSTKQIWIAKSLSVFIPGLILGEILTLATLLIVNYIYFVPTVGFLYNHWIGLSSFLAVPVVYFCFNLLTYLIGLTGKASSGNIVGQIFLPVFITLAINLMIRNILDVTSWHIFLTTIGLAAIISIIILFLISRMSREKIVLSLSQ